MGNISEHQLIAQVSGGVVAELASQELPMFTVMCEAYFANPEKMRKGLSGKEEILGLDIVGTTSLILTPIALALVDTIVKSLSEEIAGSSFIRRLLVTLPLAKKEERVVTLPLTRTPTQLREVREKAVAQAKQFKLPQNQAELLADSLIGKLSLLQS